MWFFFFKKKYFKSKISLINHISELNIEIKNKTILSELIIKNISAFNKLIYTYYTNIYYLSNIISVMSYYINITKLDYKFEYIYKNTVIFKLKKKQLYSHFLITNNLKKLISNGIITNKLSIKKSQKKDTKITFLNIKKTAEYIYTNKFHRNLVIHIHGTKHNIIKLINSIRINFSRSNTIYVYTPKINFSSNPFKKIKSIKKKLKKKYTELI